LPNKANVYFGLHEPKESISFLVPNDLSAKFGQYWQTKLIGIHRREAPHKSIFFFPDHYLGIIHEHKVPK